MWRVDCLALGSLGCFDGASCLRLLLLQLSGEGRGNGGLFSLATQAVALIGLDRGNGGSHWASWGGDHEPSCVVR